MTKTIDTWIQQHTVVHVTEFTEMICSLHVLTRPHHHPFRVEWAQNLLRQMPADMISDLHQLASVTDDWIALLDIDMVKDRRLPAEEVIQKIGLLPDGEFITLLMNQEMTLGEVLHRIHAPTQATVRSRGATGTQNTTVLRQENLQTRTQNDNAPATRNHGTNSLDIQVKRLSEAEQEAITKPKWTRRRMVTFLQNYRTHYFSEEWSRIEPWLVRAGRVFSEELQISPAKAIDTLHPRLFVRDDAIYAQKAKLYRFPYHEVSHLLVCASTFIHPHLLVGRIGTTVTVPLAVEVPGVAPRREVPADLVTMFKALSDATRLKIVQSLVQKPHCTQQLAKLHHISEAAVSKHLKILASANFVETERHGNYVFYAVKLSEVESVIVYLRHFLEQ